MPQLSALTGRRSARIASGLCLSLSLLLAACHDAPRRNPLDPELTPAVALATTTDDTAGTVTLRWSPYSGEAPFAAYRVLRHQQGSDLVDTLAEITDQARSAWTDTQAVQDRPCLYRVAVINTGGLVAPTDWQAAVPPRLPAVQATARFSAATATAEIGWTPYRGPRFAAYQIRRATTAGASATVNTVATLTDPAASGFVDQGLRGNTEYAYQVAVITTLAEEVAGPAARGSLYRLADSWVVPTLVPPQRAALTATMRLTGCPSGGVIATVRRVAPEGGQREIAVIDYSPEGATRAVSTVRPSSGLTDLGNALQQATAVTSTGRVLLAYLTLGSDARLVLDPPHNTRTLWREGAGVVSTGWYSLATAGAVVLFAADAHSFTVASDGTVTEGSDLPGRVSEVRAWPGPHGLRVGVCLPELGVLRLGDLPAGDPADWAAYLNIRILPGVGGLGRPLVLPLSFDTGPDGSLYILDPGHGRIVALNAQNQYVTEWGEPGAGPGQFAFGSGNAAGGSPDPGYLGSVAVDGLGSVYVSDRESGRIQRFEP